MQPFGRLTHVKSRALLLRYFVPCGGSLVALAVPITPLLAAQQPPRSGAQATAPSTADSGTAPAAANGGGDIIVTATRRAEGLQKVPMAISAVSQERLRSLNLSNVFDLTRATPSLTFSQGSNNQTVTFGIRGISTFANSLTLDNSVGVSVDGIAIARNSGASLELVDVDRIEVLRGPQGTLFGKNASAGLINVITRMPAIGKNSLSGRFSYGSYNELRTEATVNAAVGDTAALRLSAWNFRHDGFQYNVRRDEILGRANQQGFRGRFRWSPSESLDVNLIADVTRNKANGPFGATRVVVTDPFGVRASDAALGIIFGPGNTTVATSSPTEFDTKTYSFTGQVDYHLGHYTLTSLSGYRHVSEIANYDAVGVGDARFAQFLNNQYHRYHTTSQEVRLTSPNEGRLRYVVGLFYHYLSLDGRQIQVVPPPITPVLVSRDARPSIRNTSLAAFGQGTLNVTSALRVIAGARYTHDKVKGVFSRSYFLQPAAVVPALNGPGASFGPFSSPANISAEKVTWTVGAQYDVTPTIMAYATTSTGYKGPGLAFTLDTGPVSFAANNGYVRPETSRSYELGLKSQFLDRRLTFNVALYSETFKDFQALARFDTGTSVTSFGIVNARSLRSRGVEIEASARPVEGLTISGYVTYNDAKFTDFNNAPCYVGQTLAQGCVNRVQDLTGVRLSIAPKWTHSGTIRYETAVSENLSAFVQGSYQFIGRQLYNNSNDPLESQKGYAVVNLNSGFGPADGRWRLGFYANNLFKQNFVSRVINTATVGKAYANIPTFASRRTFGGVLEFKFQ